MLILPLLSLLWQVVGLVVIDEMQHCRLNQGNFLSMASNGPMTIECKYDRGNAITGPFEPSTLLLGNGIPIRYDNSQGQL